MIVRLLAAALACVWVALPARAEPPVEYKIQTAYVSKFLRFVEWPGEAVSESAYVVGVVGNRSFREAAQALDGYAVGDRVVELRFLESTKDVRDLHVLVIGPSVRAMEFLDVALDWPVLTVSEATDFNEAGGIVQFVVVDDTIRFQINNAAAEAVGLRLSSRLLRLARKVITDWQR